MNDVPFKVLGRRVVAVTEPDRDTWRLHLEDRVHDVSNVRGPQSQVYRRGSITDVVLVLRAETGGVSLGWGPSYAKCRHGNVWPEGDYCAPRGRACPRCVSEWHAQRRVS